MINKFGNLYLKLTCAPPTFSCKLNLFHLSPFSTFPNSQLRVCLAIMKSFGKGVGLIFWRIKPTKFPRKTLVKGFFGQCQFTSNFGSFKMFNKIIFHWDSKRIYVIFPIGSVLKKELWYQIRDFIKNTRKWYIRFEQMRLATFITVW